MAHVCEVWINQIGDIQVQNHTLGSNGFMGEYIAKISEVSDDGRGRAMAQIPVIRANPR